MILNGDGNVEVLSDFYSKHDKDLAGLLRFLWGNRGGTFVADWDRGGMRCEGSRDLEDGSGGLGLRDMTDEEEMTMEESFSALYEWRLGFVTGQATGFAC